MKKVFLIQMVNVFLKSDEIYLLECVIHDNVQISTKKRHLMCIPKNRN